jgi:hypothetical protein
MARNAAFRDAHTPRLRDLVGESVVPLGDYVPSTAEGRHEEKLWEPVYARRFVKAKDQSPRATNGWTK